MREKKDYYINYMNKMSISDLQLIGRHAIVA